MVVLYTCQFKKNSHLLPPQCESGKGFESVRVNIEQSILFVDYQDQFLSQALIASSSDLLPESQTLHPSLPSLSCHSPGHRPFPYIFLSVPDLPSPCFLIFPLSSYFTFLSLPTTPNLSITHLYHFFSFTFILRCHGIFFSCCTNIYKSVSDGVRPKKFEETQKPLRKI